jgi:hypothetical protein
MADEAQLSQALINAHNAGDVEAARMIAGEIQKMRSTASAPPKSEPYKGSILPFSTDEQGNVKFDTDAGILGPIKRAVMLPGEVLKGKVDPMSDEGIKRSFEMASVISPVSAAMEAGERAIPGALGNYTREKVAVPTAPELKAAKDAAYNAIENSGVEYSGQAIQGMVRNLKDALTQKAAIAENYPKTYRLLDQLDNAPEGSGIQLKFLDALRKELGRLGGGDEGFAAKKAISAIDEFIDAADPSSLMARTSARALPSANPGAVSTAEQAARTIREARGNAAAGFRSNAIQGIEDAADLRAAAANSGKNLGNTLRQKLATLLLDEDAVRGFTPQEIEAATKIVTGSPAANITRDVSNLLGGGGGLAQALLASGGAALGAPFGGVGAAVGAAVPMGVGRTARGISNSITKSEASKLAELLRMRSPLYQQRLENAAIEYSDPATRAAIARALKLGSMPNTEE